MRGQCCTVNDVLPLDDSFAVALQVSAVHRHAPGVGLEVLALQLHLFHN